MRAGGVTSERAAARPLVVAVAGSVDDGKSTLLGRLLSDTERVFADEVEAVRRASGASLLNLAFFTDGLMGERARGITMDVAWRHAVIGGRRLLLADVPGHTELVRNMATGASVADAAVLLVDVVRGVQQQTRRHLVMLHGLGVTQVVVCLNKMDGVGFARQVAMDSSAPLTALGAALGLQLDFLPLSALEGDNVVHRGARLGWYSGPTLAQRLTTLEVRPVSGAFAVVQLATDAQGWTSLHRLGGAWAAGDTWWSSTGGRVRFDEVSPLGAGRVRLDVPQPRGTLLSAAPPPLADRWPVVVTWLGPAALEGGSALSLLQHGRRTGTRVTALRRRSLDTGALQPAESLAAGDVAEATLELEQPTWIIGPALLVDADGRTVGAVRSR